MSLKSIKDSIERGPHVPADFRSGDNFKCSKCNGTDCTVKEIAMTGAGLSKLLDIQHNHYLFVSCINCGSVEIYDPNVLEDKKVGKLGSIIDVLFGS
ncbi:zinc ribbon domain-containing protein [Paenibacillus sp. YAF4_2]|uniref:zinc ribbon domain-containing protein n=1 Tax=Paenibacillus sp. YAF4_2 TaxID=3233085 RepID=UPI003F9DC01B